MSLDQADRDAVAAAITNYESKQRDPYRTALHFFAGGITICLALIAGLLAGLESAKGIGSAAVQMVGGAIAWTAVAFFLSLVFITVVQALKLARNWQGTPSGPAPDWQRKLMLGLMYAGTLTAVPVFLYAVRGGSALLNGKNDELPGFLEGIAGLFV